MARNNTVDDTDMNTESNVIHVLSKMSSKINYAQKNVDVLRVVER